MRANHYALLATTLTLLACSCSLAIMHDSQVSLLSVLFVFLLPTLLVALASTILLSAAPTLFERAAVSPSGQMTSAADEPASKDEADVTETAVKEDKADAKDAADTKEAGSPKTRWKKVSFLRLQPFLWLTSRERSSKSGTRRCTTGWSARRRRRRRTTRTAICSSRRSTGPTASTTRMGIHSCSCALCPCRARLVLSCGSSSTALVKVLRGMPDIKDQEELWAEDPSVVRFIHSRNRSSSDGWHSKPATSSSSRPNCGRRLHDGRRSSRSGRASHRRPQSRPKMRPPKPSKRSRWTTWARTRRRT
jgi:hypothetical protein